MTREEAWRRVCEAAGRSKDGEILPPPADYAIDRDPVSWWGSGEMHGWGEKPPPPRRRNWWRRHLEYSDPTIDTVVGLTIAIVLAFGIAYLINLFF